MYYKNLVKLLLGLFIGTFFVPFSFGIWYSHGSLGGNNDTCDTREAVQISGTPSDGDTNRTLSWNGSLRKQDTGPGNTSATCLRRDPISPNVGATSPSGNRENTDIDITLSVNDPNDTSNGRSRSGIATSKYSWDNPNCFGGNNFSDGNTITLSNEGRHTLYVCARDNAGNETTNSYGPYKLDKTPPSINSINDPDITLDTNNRGPVNGGGNALADRTAQISFDYNEGSNNQDGCSGSSCAPLDNIDFDREDGSTGNKSCNDNSNTEDCNQSGISWDVSDVDSDRENYGGRNFKFTIDKICDVAGNCSSSNSFTWKVFANQVHSSFSYSNNFSSIKTGDNNAYFSGSITLKDEYDNEIIPTDTIDRKVKLSIDYDNNAYLNQYNTGGKSGIRYWFSERDSSDYYFTKTGNSKTNNIIYTDNNGSSATESKNNSTYEVRFKSYVPTNEGYDKAYGDFTINYVEAEVTDVGIGSGSNTSKKFLTSKKLKFKPFVEADIDDSFTLAPMGQQGDFDVTLSKNSSESISDGKFVTRFWTGGAPIKTYLKEQGNSWTPHNDCLWSEYDDISNDISNDFASQSSCTRNNSNNELDDSLTNLSSDKTYNLSEKFELLSGETMDPNEMGFISTHIAVEYGPNTIAKYNSDIVGKDCFECDVEPSSAFKSLSVKGLVSATDFSKLNTTISTDKRAIAGGISKSELRSLVKRSKHEFTKGFEAGNLSSTGNIDLNYPSGISPHFEVNGTNVFWYKYDGGDALTIEGNKNLSEKVLVITEGVDTYIKGDIETSGDGMFGVVSLQSENNNIANGDIYIENTITNLDSYIYADGGVVSYSGDVSAGNLEYQNEMTLDELRHQLKITGVLWTFNTLGASQQNPPKCPYFMDSCDRTKAEKYDLEFLRRYYLAKANSYHASGQNNSWIPYSKENNIVGNFSSTKSIGGVKCKLDDNDGDDYYDVVCKNKDGDLKNEIPGISTSGDSKTDYIIGSLPEDISSNKRDKFSPIVLEYDSRFKDGNFPIFSDLAN